MYVNSQIVLSVASQHFNSRIEPVAFVLKCKQMGSDYDPFKPNKLVLPVQNKSVFRHLASSNYQSLLKNLLNMVRIEPLFAQVFSSELATDMMDFFTMFLEKASRLISITANEEKLIFFVDTNDMFADLVLTPLSIFHTEITETIIQYQKYIEAIGGDSKQLFLNANASTAFSYFIQMWVAETMGIPFKSDADILVIQENDL